MVALCDVQDRAPVLLPKEAREWVEHWRAEGRTFARGSIADMRFEDYLAMHDARWSRAMFTANVMDQMVKAGHAALRAGIHG